MDHCRREQLIARFEALAATLDDGGLCPSRREALEAQLGRHATAYGELLPRGFPPALAALGARAGDHLLDLGSGRGLFVLAAPLLVPGLMATGIEIARERHDLAHAAAQQLRQDAPSHDIAPPAPSAGALDPTPNTPLRHGPSTLLHGDLRHTPWPAASLVWLANTALPAPVESKAISLLVKLEPLRRLLTTRRLPSSSHGRLEALGELDLPVSWTTRQRVHLYAPKGA